MTVQGPTRKRRKDAMSHRKAECSYHLCLFTGTRMTPRAPSRRILSTVRLLQCCGGHKNIISVPQDLVAGLELHHLQSVFHWSMDPIGLFCTVDILYFSGSQYPR